MHQARPSRGFKRLRGFTLIEVMVVVAIIAIMVGAVVLRIDFNNIGKIVRDHAQRTRLLMELAADQAIYSRQQLGIRFHPNSYEFYILTGNEDGEGTWEIFEDGRLKYGDVKATIEYRVDIEGLPIVLEELEEELAAVTEDSPIKPHVLFLSNGEVMPDFRVVIADEESEFEHAIYTGEIEPIVLEQLNE